jgi:non-specific serine/threonine protein kinase
MTSFDSGGDEAARPTSQLVSPISASLNDEVAHSPGPLPRQLTSFIGRERELAEVNRLLAEAATGSRLLTLTGPGGCGKTRLALRVAEGRRAAGAAGVAVVELAALADPSLAVQFVANALGVHDVMGRPPLTALVEHLRPRDVLLVLDNCEHLVDACATLVETLLGSCPHLAVLATSREMLGVPGEIAWAVPALSTPDPASLTADPEKLVSEALHYEAVCLFGERARLSVPTFQVTPQNAATLARICRRLDGMPLPIELAAARVRHLALDQIEEHLNDCFPVLAAGSRTALSRHRTLWATIDWSYALLDEPERSLFRQLAVFAGGFTLDAARAVCGASLELLGHLVDKSLVVVEPGDGRTARYRLLETIRQFAQEKLRASGETAAAQLAHARYYLAYAETAEPGLTSPDRVFWLARLEAEHDNLRAALDWSQRPGSEIAIGLRLAGALWWFWNMRYHVSEGFDRVTAVLAQPEGQSSNEARARALGTAAALAYLRRDYEVSRARAAEAVNLWREVGNPRGLGFALTVLGLATLKLGQPSAATPIAAESVAVLRGADDPWWLAYALNNLGYVNSAAGDDTAARTHLTESLEGFRQLDDRWGMALALSNLGSLAYRLGDYPRARVQLEESLAIFRAVDHFWIIPRTLNTLGHLARFQGEPAQAVARYAESLHLCEEHGDQAGQAESLANLARVAQGEGDFPRAVLLFRQALTIFRAQGQRRGVGACLAGLAGLAAASGLALLAVRLFAASEAHRGEGDPLLSPANRVDIERDLSIARRALSEAAFATAWQAGRALAVDAAIVEALTFEVSAASTAQLSVRTDRTSSPLTGREAEVVALISGGLSNRQIADALVVSERTVESHIASVRSKLNLDSRARIAVWAAEHGLASPRPA